MGTPGDRLILVSPSSLPHLTARRICPLGGLSQWSPGRLREPVPWLMLRSNGGECSRNALSLIFRPGRFCSSPLSSLSSPQSATLCRDAKTEVALSLPIFFFRMTGPLDPKSSQNTPIFCLRGLFFFGCVPPGHGIFHSGTSTFIFGSPKKQFLGGRGLELPKLREPQKKKVVRTSTIVARVRERRGMMTLWR